MEAARHVSSLSLTIAEHEQHRVLSLLRCFPLVIHVTCYDIGRSAAEIQTLGKLTHLQSLRMTRAVRRDDDEILHVTSTLMTLPSFHHLWVPFMGHNGNISPLIGEVAHILLGHHLCDPSTIPTPASMKMIQLRTLFHKRPSFDQRCRHPTSMLPFQRVITFNDGIPGACHYCGSVGYPVQCDACGQRVVLCPDCIVTIPPLLASDRTGVCSSCNVNQLCHRCMNYCISCQRDAASVIRPYCASCLHHGYCTLCWEEGRAQHEDDDDNDDPDDDLIDEPDPHHNDIDDDQQDEEGESDDHDEFVAEMIQRIQRGNHTTNNDGDVHDDFA